MLLKTRPTGPAARLPSDDKALAFNTRLRTSTIAAIEARARAEGATLKQVICRALFDAGIAVAPADLQDGTPRSEGSMSDYDTDILTWSERQATLLRRRAAGELVNDAEIDWPNVAEEIESVGRSERRELRNRMARLQQHLLKWRYQPEHRSRSWRTTITTQRREIEALLADSPSLRATLPDVLAASYRAARDDAITETGLLDLPENPPFTVEQALNDPLTD